MVVFICLLVCMCVVSCIKNLIMRVVCMEYTVIRTHVKDSFDKRENQLAINFPFSKGGAPR